MEACQARCPTLLHFLVPGGGRSGHKLGRALKEPAATVLMNKLYRTTAGKYEQHDRLQTGHTFASRFTAS